MLHTKRHARLARLAVGLSLGLALGLSATPTWAAKAVALLIGNADYSHERKLNNPVNDAVLLGSVLTNDLKFDDVRVERNLGVAAMDRAIAAFVERAKGAETIVFYYSGHGMKKSANDRRNFLLPVDARTGTADALDLERQAVAAEAIRDRLRGLGARVTLIVLDACRDGPGGGRTGSKGLSRNGGGNQLLVAYATEEDQVAEDGAGRNSTYAAALAQALKRPEPLLAQLDWVADEVQRLVPGQTPTRDGNLRHNAYLVGGSVVAVAAAASSSPSPTPAPAPGLVTSSTAALAPRPGDVIKDCAECPEMVLIPAGSFLMGSPDNELARGNAEGPQRHVSVPAFALGKTEVTFAQWDACVAAGGCRHRPGDQGWGRGSRPVINVSWDDAQAYVRWLSAKTKQRYLLPSEAQWEYATRAGTSTPFHTGSTITTAQANFDGRYTYNGSSEGESRLRTVPVGSFPANDFGLQDMHGNVWELVQDCFVEGAYAGKAPSDGRAFEVVGCTERVRRGGAWHDFPTHLRAAERFWVTQGARRDDTGFRLARMLP